MARTAVWDGDLVSGIDVCFCVGLASATAATSARGRLEFGKGWAGVVECICRGGI